MKRAATLVVATLLAGAAGLAAQQADVRGRLLARGLPADLAAAAADITLQAEGQGLPTGPLVDKAIEGWAKRVPAPRIVTALRELALRLATARDALAGAGERGAAEGVVGAGAEAMARGITREQVVAIVTAAPADAAAAAGLSVAAALAAQGLDRDASVLLVIESFRRGHSAADVLDLPSAARAMQGRGTPLPEVGQQLLEGLGPPPAHGRGARTGRPPAVPPGLGEPPPASSKRP